MSKQDNKKERTLIGSNYCTDFYNYTMYVEWCEANEIEPAEKDSQEYYDWVSDEECIDYDDFFTNLSYSKADKEIRHYVITFDLGLWDGHHKGYVEKTFETLSEAIKEALNSSRDYQDYKVTYENGRVYVHGLHHDGTNILEIRLLSKKGESALVYRKSEPDWERAIENERNFKRLKLEDLW
jgi:hypothetical protein